jgi:hypothetical protein
MVENFNTLIAKLVRSGLQDQDHARIPVPIAVESDSDEAWADFQESESSYDREYATTVCGTL